MDVYEGTTELLKPITRDAQKMLKEVSMKTNTKRLNIFTKNRKAKTSGVKKKKKKKKTSGVEELAFFHELLETTTHKKDGILTWIKDFHEKN